MMNTPKGFRRMPINWLSLIAYVFDMFKKVHTKKEQIYKRALAALHIRRLII